MARAGWHNENEYRDYPFLDQAGPLGPVIDGLPGPSSSSSASSSTYYDLPTEAIVDCGAVMGPLAGFIAPTHNIHLHRISRFDPYFVYELRVNATLAESESLVFIRNHQIAAPYTTEWVASRALGDPDPLPESSSSSAAISMSETGPRTHPGSLDADCDGPGCEDPLWEGYLVTGRFEALLELLADDESLLFGPRTWVVEPGRIQNLSLAYAHSINLANEDRSRAAPEPPCGSSSSDAAAPIYPQATCLQGLIQFKEGYHCAIRQEDDNNALVISGAVGGGEGAACEELERFPGETAPAGSPFLTGGPGCGELITTINGKGGRRLQIEAGPGLRINAHPDDASTLIIHAALDDFAVCLEADGSSSC